MTDAVEDPAAPGVERGPRGRPWVYGIAFVLLLVSTYFQFSGAIGTGGLTVVWSSIALSAAAAAAATAAVLAPGRRLRTAPVDASSGGEADVDGSPAIEKDRAPRGDTAAKPGDGAPAADGDGEEAPAR
ncbi:MAG: hypothetical protein ACJ77A_10775 [Actinomycetota bacterium]